MASIISIVIAYLLGSLNMGILLSKILKTPDPRSSGSGSAGATNVLRTIGKNQAIAVVVGDALKGLIAVIIGHIFGVIGFMLGFVALAAVAGHIFPLYFKFKGGKGVATTLGAFLGLSFLVGIIAIIAWVAVAYFMKYSSLASLVSILLACIAFLIFGKAVYFIPALLIAALVFWKHTDNIKRLRAGTESKIQFNK